MEKSEIKNLEEIAKKCRCDVINMITEAKSGHPGGSLSCIDILVALYFGGVLNHSPQDPKFENRDRFILAKGHAAPALYAILGECGYFEKDNFSTLRKVGSILQGHPDMHKCPGVEVSTGSLGQGLSISCGEALGLKMNGSLANVFTLLGDGELQEGQVWEAAMFASHYSLDNLIAIVDNNGLQIDGKVDDVLSLGNISNKFQSFGWETYEVDGHNIQEIINLLNDIKMRKTHKPKCVIAKTIKGKGVSFMENQAQWHGKAPNSEQAKQALDELSA